MAWNEQPNNPQCRNTDGKPADTRKVIPKEGQARKAREDTLGEDKSPDSALELS